VEIRSYRRVFDLERRIYRVDRLRLNPGGVPVRGVVYFLVILAAALIAGRLPLLGSLARLLPWYAGDLALPAASAAVLTMIRVEGRPFHLAAHALVRYHAGPRWLAGVHPSVAIGSRWSPEDVVFLPDGSDSWMRRMHYTGPGAVLIAVDHQHRGGNRRESVSLGLRGNRAALSLSESPGTRTAAAGGRVLALAPGARLLIRSSDRSRRVKR
jgi:hypothetical protein